MEGQPLRQIPHRHQQVGHIAYRLGIADHILFHPGGFPQRQGPLKMGKGPAGDVQLAIDGRQMPQRPGDPQLTAGLLVQVEGAEEVVERLAEIARLVIGLTGMQIDLGQKAGVIQGGYLVAMMDDTIGMLAGMKAGKTKLPSTVDLHTHFLRPVRKGAIEVAARLRNVGRAMLFAEAELYDSRGKEAARSTASLTLNPVEDLDVFLTYGYNHSRFDDTDDAGNPQIYAGNRFRLSPDHSLSAGFTYRKPLSFGTAYLTPTYTWKSSVYFEDENTDAYAVVDPATMTTLYTVPTIGQDAFGLLNIRGGVEFKDGRFVVEGYAQNLLDKEYIIDAGNTGGGFGIPTYIAGAPRYFGGGVKVRF